jgi:hypothetical protein
MYTSLLPHPPPLYQGLLVTPLPPGSTLTIPDPSSSTFNAYGDVDKAALLFSSLMANQQAEEGAWRANHAVGSLFQGKGLHQSFVCMRVGWGGVGWGGVG